MHKVDIIDSHTGGEPTRVVLSGLPDLGHGSLPERRDIFRDKFDAWRRAITCEPRGSLILVGALLLPPQHADACAGVIFFNSVGYLGMCGHGTIGLARTLLHQGLVQPGKHLLETPVGLVGMEIHADGRAAVDNVESYRLAANVAVNVPGYGTVHGDIAWGGNWFFISRDCPLPLELAHQHDLTTYTTAVYHALHAAGITGADGAVVDHVEINLPSPTRGVNGRSFVLCPSLTWDRSPCGTGTSAKLACLAADGKLRPGETWRQESILGSVFDASFEPATRGVLPRITGIAHITAHTTLLIDDSDPFAWGSGAQ